MSVFAISTNHKHAEAIKDELENLYEKRADLYNFGQVHLIITAAYKDNYLMKTFKEGSIFVLGTIFNFNGFHEQALELYDSFDGLISALKNEKQLFFGHYLIIAVFSQENKVEIIPDRIGMINTYYSATPNHEIYISNDILLVSRQSQNYKICRQALYEFLLTESNVGSKTIFSNIFRLKAGNELVLEQNQINEKIIYNYEIENLNTTEYLARIEEYFNCFNHYPQKLALDVSAGYDTRLILSIANKCIKNVEGFHSFNEHDNGIDHEISQIIAQRMNMKLHFSKCADTEEFQKNYEHVLHGASVLRDAARSVNMPDRLKEKYQIFDLALGGYGGEIMRAKYNKYSNIEDFVKDYYKGNEAKKICGFKDYQRNLLEELKEYPIPLGMNPELLQNWYYAIAKMRIWGSGFIQMSSLYGDVVHPFMDWYLLNPLFGFPLQELKNAKLQESLLHTYASYLDDIPINQHMGKKPSAKEKLKKYCLENKCFQSIGTPLYCYLRNLKETENIKNTGSLENLSNNKDINRMLTKLGKRIRSRAKTVLQAYLYSKGKACSDSSEGEESWE